jgi:hypothetical protein
MAVIDMFVVGVACVRVEWRIASRVAWEIQSAGMPLS